MLTELMTAIGVDNPVMAQVLAFATLISFAVTALVQVVKLQINLPKNRVPLIGLAVGLLIGAAAYPFTELDLVLRLWAGGFAGLSATGLFETFFNKRTGGTKDENWTL